MSKINFQSLGTLLALVISIVALFTSIYEARIMDSQQRAMVWPYLQLTPVFNSDGYSLKGINYGTGPAIVTSVEVTYKGELVPNVDSLLNLMKPDRSIGYDRLITRSFNNTVYKTEEDRVLFFMPWTEETREMVKYFQYVDMTLCYKSVLGDEWTFNLQSNTHEEASFKSRLEFEN